MLLKHGWQSLSVHPTLEWFEVQSSQFLGLKPTRFSDRYYVQDSFLSERNACPQRFARTWAWEECSCCKNIAHCWRHYLHVPLYWLYWSMMKSIFIVWAGPHAGGLVHMLFMRHVQISLSWCLPSNFIRALWKNSKKEIANLPCTCSMPCTRFRA